MKPPCWYVVALCIAGSPLHSKFASTAFNQQTPVFRVSATSVSVDVSVRSGNLPVGGLIITDFSLSDQGVPQEIALVEVSSLPVDVTVVVDVSPRAGDRLERFQADINEIGALLRPVDRLRLITYGYDVVEALSLQSVGTSPRLERAVSLGGTSLHDAMVTALIQPSHADRRRLVVVLADRTDTLSVIPAAKVLAVARRADAVLHIIGLQDGCVSRTTSWRYDELPPPDLLPTRPVVRHAAALPCLPDDFETLSAAAGATGGNVHGLSWISASAVQGFKRAFDDFRTSYLLRYTPRGVPTEGWHEISVKVLRTGKFSVRARNGYFGGSAK